MGQYIKLSKLASTQQDLIDIENTSFYQGTNMAIKVLDTDAEMSDIIKNLYQITYLSNLPAETLEIYTKLPSDTLSFNQISDNKLGINKKTLAIENNDEPPIYKLLNSTDITIPIKNYFDLYDYQKTVLSAFVNDPDIPLNSSQKIFKELKFDGQYILKFDINMKGITSLSILNNEDTLIKINLCKFDALKMLDIKNTKCVGSIYIGKLDSQIDKIDISNSDFNYIEVEGNNTILTPENFIFEQKTNKPTIKFINCRPTEDLLSLIDNYIID